MPAVTLPKLEAVEEITAYTRKVGADASRGAREAVAQTTLTAVDTLVACTGAAQQMAAEVTSLTLAKAKDAYAMQAEVSASALKALGEKFGATVTDQPAVAAWQKLVADGAAALDRFAEQVKAAIDAGNSQIKDAVDTVALRVKDSNAQFTTTIENLEQSAVVKA